MRCPKNIPLSIHHRYNLLNHTQHHTPNQTPSTPPTMKYTTPFLLFIAALTTANPVTSPSANAITSANPLVARDPICDKCNKEFEDCQKVHFPFPIFPSTIV